MPEDRNNFTFLCSSYSFKKIVYNILSTYVAYFMFFPGLNIHIIVVCNISEMQKMLIIY